MSKSNRNKPAAATAEQKIEDTGLASDIQQAQKLREFVNELKPLLPINPAEEFRDPAVAVSEEAGDLRSDQWHGRETMPQPGGTMIQQGQTPADKPAAEKPVYRDPEDYQSAARPAGDIVMVTITIPVLKEKHNQDVHGYAGTRFDADLSGALGERCKQTIVGLSSQHTTYNLGGRIRHVDSCNDVLRWVFDQIDQQLNAAVQEPS